MKVSEKQFQGTVERAAALLGWKHYHVFDSRRSPEGFPDLVLVRGPRLLFAELKTATGKLSPYQEKWLGALRLVQQAPEIYVWRPSDWGQIEGILRGEQ